MHGKSTSSSSQRERILTALQRRPHTSYELRKMGCYQANTRILELRRQGYNIATERVSIWDDEGYCHSGVARYTLLGGKQ
ncbi:helix-turn-helix domain-containing protein [Kerstersia gyiorum]|uniref:helix-turn-helix domain-containing protein n=1 Tax=Kerstersia gyiorum TaxID=206506 RepID=UPI00142FE7AB|nr:helix-turn-helix domain-containing protein [Kerstersia gyiorum]